MAQRVKALFTDEDLFEVHIPPQPRRNGGVEAVSVQTDVILASNTGTMTTRTSEMGTMTDDASKGSKTASSSNTMNDTGEGKDDTEEKGDESKDDNSKGDNSDVLLGSMLRRTAPLLEAELLSNASSTALNGYPPTQTTSLALLGATDESGSACGGGGGSGGSSGGGGMGDQQHHVSLKPPKQASTQGLQCTGVGWNAGGGVLVAAYGRRDMGGWCESGGVLCAWPLFRRDFDPEAPPEVMVEHSSCLMCVACHPTIPSLVACGSFNGEVLVFDLTLANTSSSLGASSSASSASSSSSLRAVVMGEGDGGNDDDVNGDDGNGGGPLIHASSIDDYFHREPVRSVRWCWDQDVKSHSLASVSSDGKVLFWQLKHGLQFPLRGTKLRLRKPVTGFEGGGRSGPASSSSSSHSDRSGSGLREDGGGGGLKGLRVAVRAGAVHGGTCVAFTCSAAATASAAAAAGGGGGDGGGETAARKDGSNHGNKSGGGGGGGPSMLGSVMVVGSEAGALLAWPPPPPLKKVGPRPNEGGGGGGGGGGSSNAMSWDSEARKLLGFVRDDNARGLVCQQVERWVKETSSSSKHVSAVAVFKAKPDDDALFNGSIASGASSSSSLSNSGGETRFDSHVGPVLGLSCSPFHRLVFASCGADGALKIGSLLQARPLLTLDTGSSSNGGGSSGGGVDGGGGIGCASCLNDVAWSPVRPLLLACASEGGAVFLYDLGKSTSLPVARLKPTAAAAASSSASSSSSSSSSSYRPSNLGGVNSPCLSVCFNPKMRAFVAFGDASGGVHVHRMGSSLAYAQSNEAAKLGTLVSSLSEDTTTGGTAAS